MKDLMAKQLAGRGWFLERVVALHSGYEGEFPSIAVIWSRVLIELGSEGCNMEGMKTRYLILWTLLATLITAALYLWPHYGVVVGDTYVMRKAHLIPGNSTFQYWWSVFSQANHGPQYRPVGFFAYFWVMGKLFNSSLASLALASYFFYAWSLTCLLYTSPSPRDRQKSRMPSSA